MLTENLTRLLGREAELLPVPLEMAYPQSILIKEAIKALIGVVGSFVIVFVFRPTPYIGWPVAVAGLLFLMYLVQQISRYFLRLRVDETGLIQDLGALRKAIRWSELKDMRLNFYPQSKGNAQGTLVLILKDGRSRIKLDSTVDQFPTVLSRAAEAARKSGIALHPTTEENLGQLGL